MGRVHYIYIFIYVLIYVFGKGGALQVSLYICSEPVFTDIKWGELFPTVPFSRINAYSSMAHMFYF
jgi:hypothetical protein